MRPRLCSVCLFASSSRAASVSRSRCVTDSVLCPRCSLCLSLVPRPLVCEMNRFRPFSCKAHIADTTSTLCVAFLLRNQSLGQHLYTLCFDPSYAKPAAKATQQLSVLPFLLRNPSLRHHPLSVSPFLLTVLSRV